MRKVVQFFPRSYDEFDDSYLLVQMIDGSRVVNFSHLDPLEHPKIHPYEDTGYQLKVLGEISYRQLFLSCGYIDATAKETIEISLTLDNQKLFHIPIYNDALPNDSVLWSKVGEYIVNPAIEFTQNDSAKLLMVMAMIGYQTRVLNTIDRWLEDTPMYGTFGMVSLLYINNLSVDLIETTSKDYIRFLKKFPNRKVPEQAFSVHALDCPFSSDVPIDAETLTCHLHYIEMIDYLRWKCKKAITDAHTRYYVAKEKEILPFHLSELLNLKVKNDEKLREMIKKRKTKINYTIDIEDLDILYNRSAPCVQKMLDKNGQRFPTDDVRTTLVRILQKGHVSLEVVERIFQIYFDKYPSSEHATLKARFDLWYQYDKEYAAPNCETMTCPFQQNTVEERKHACHLSLKKRAPEKYRERDFKFLWGPSSWYYWTK